VRQRDLTNNTKEIQKFAMMRIDGEVDDQLLLINVYITGVNGSVVNFEVSSFQLGCLASVRQVVQPVEPPYTTLTLLNVTFFTPQKGQFYWLYLDTNSSAHDTTVRRVSLDNDTSSHQIVTSF
jgi:hypothetical protein